MPVSPPPLPSATPSSALPARRIPSLDLIRGVAILGILLVNILVFARVDDAYTNPTAHPNFTNLDILCWNATHLLADLKFLSLFSLLFGAGIAIVAGKRADTATPLWPFWFYRMAWLFGIGMIHAYLIWEGDILVSYAFCGLIVAPLHSLAPKRLFLIGGAALVVGSLIWLGLGALTRIGISFDPSVKESLASDAIGETTAMQGNVVDQFLWRAPFVFLAQLFGFPAFSLWRCGGLMLIGMGLLKSGFFHGQFSRLTYWRIVLIGLPLGYLITGLGIALRSDSDWDIIICNFEGFVINYWGSLVTTFAYASILILWASGSFLGSIQNALSAIGRTTLSNYLFQSLLATLIFNGHGLGLFGELSHPELWTVVVVIWMAQISLTLVWLKFFQTGPIEWLWRRLSYGTSIPLRREPQ